MPDPWQLFQACQYICTQLCYMGLRLLTSFTGLYEGQVGLFDTKELLTWFTQEGCQVYGSAALIFMTSVPKNLGYGLHGLLCCCRWVIMVE